MFRVGNFRNLPYFCLKFYRKQDKILHRKNCSALKEVMNFPRQIMVSVEGNIGCGKTTLLNYFDQFDNVETMQEPIEQWINVDGHNSLEQLYQDPSRWSFTFNSHALLTRVDLHTRPPTKTVRMLERSVFSTYHCFIRNNFLSKDLNGLEFAVLKKWFHWLIYKHNLGLDQIVYLKADPHLCFERLKKRCRKEEDPVPVSLLENLHKIHEEWLIKQSYGPLPAPVKVIDTNLHLEKLFNVYEEEKSQILCQAL
ncbi:thymidine kinase 2, mitochondrial isoform X1 [Octopus bimaculoides]|uniref:Deoxynucleoside kinase domain-containing protein n=2 Tax=Octopus bimaculoides TaxID=37653 RepID=A0A0L8GMY9_OCTBM|nr:thymidine kinase 2, mitochondrial isoform X1 [Octopus bimaculoides]|eukprot:XP_014779571.1 PREDICTED: thymidine kinase 2, mitochondrial-like isoform X1 [Octopus bimaculoides]